MRKLIVIAIILLTGMGVSFNNTKKVNEKWGDNGTANRYKFVRRIKGKTREKSTGN